MAENLDMPQMGNFSIQDTMDMGMGNQELLNDLMGPDSATSNPDDIQDIKDEPVKGIQDFLYGEDDEEDEGDEPAPAPAKKTVAQLSLIHI